MPGKVRTVRAVFCASRWNCWQSSASRPVFRARCPGRVAGRTRSGSRFGWFVNGL